MAEKHVTPEMLAGKVIDAHSHLGVYLKAYSRLEYPYAQDIEGLYYRQLAAKVDVNVVFPFSPDLFFEPVELMAGNMVPARNPLSEAPFAKENRMLLQEIFLYCPELSHRFIPFACIDPGRRIGEQIQVLEKLEREFPLYGIKVNPILTQSRVGELSGRGKDFIAFGRERNLPFLFHMSSDMNEIYSSPEDTFRIIEENPDIRFCLAHCINFDKRYLKRTGELPNAWFDTAAIKIVARMYHENNPRVRPPELRFETDYSDHKKVMLSLAEAYPEKIIWGSDSPAYTFISRRKQAEGQFMEYRLKGTYEEEKAALDALPENLRRKAGNGNTIRFIFGSGA